MSQSRQSTSAMMPEVYRELRRLAGARLHADAVTLQPTAIVHEAFLKLSGKDWTWENRAHFFTAAAEAIRRVLLDYAREKSAQKRGAGRQQVTLSGISGDDAMDVDALALDSAISALEARDEDMAAVVKLRFFCGLSMPEIAEALEMSERSAARRWHEARIWIYGQLTDVE